uniref:Uncharacterized protein n=1 Tax=Sphaerodactylus townsendi TaxID=933632 RepID=A0ACB8FNJ0_9SAUR
MGLGQCPSMRSSSRCWGDRTINPPHQLRATECVVTASADAAARDSTSVGSNDLETIDTRPLQVSTPSPTSQAAELLRFAPTVSTSEISNSLEDDATQIPMSQMSALFADTSGDMNDVLDHPIAGSSGGNEGSIPMAIMELTSPERRMTAERLNGEAEVMERRRIEDWREREVASFMQSRAEQNSELSSLRLAIDRGNDIMQTLVTALLQQMGSSGGGGAGGSCGASAPEVASHTLPAPAFEQCRPTCAIAGPAANLRGDAAEVNYPTLAEDTELESFVGATAPLPSEVEDLMMVGETSELCSTQADCQESQPMHKHALGGSPDGTSSGPTVIAATRGSQEASLPGTSFSHNGSACCNTRGDVVEAKRLRKPKARMDL